MADDITETGFERLEAVRCRQQGHGLLVLYRRARQSFFTYRHQLWRPGDAEQNAEIVNAVLSGQPGPKLDIVLLNSAYALVAAGLVADIDAGIERAREVIITGRAKSTLDALVRMTNT